jgi:hypothetical protein
LHCQPEVDTGWYEPSRADLCSIPSRGLLTGRFGARDLRAKGGIQLEQPDSQGRRDKEKEGDGKDPPFRLGNVARGSSGKWKGKRTIRMKRKRGGKEELDLPLAVGSESIRKDLTFPTRLIGADEDR